MSMHHVHGSPLREVSADAVAGLGPSLNVTQLLLDRAAATPDAVLFARRTERGWTPVTAAQFLEQVRALARGLIASGLDTGDRVAIVSAGSYEWALVDFAVWFAGGVTVPIDEASSVSQIASLLADSRARRVFVQDAGLARRVDDAVHGHPEFADTFVPITVMDDDGEGATLRSLAGPGLGVSEAELERHRAAAGLEALATVVHTAGTTGQPKACEISHRNLALLAVNLGAHLPSVVGPGAGALLAVPPAHVLARAVQAACVAAGVVVGHSRPADLIADLGTFRPTFLVAVPRVLETAYEDARASASQGLRGAVFERAARAAREYSQALESAAAGSGDGPGRRLRLRRALFDRLVYARLRAAAGGRLDTILCGASALSPPLAHFFRGAGLSVLECYGLSETAGPCTVNTPEATRVGTVGRPLPGTTIRISDGGEVLVKGIGVMSGYSRAVPGSPEAGAFTPEGFLATGDLGQLDADGFLSITGRAAASS